MKLLIGNRNYSSWSLRAWLLLRLSRVPFEVEQIALFSERWQREIRLLSPSGRVPVLFDGEVTVWDTSAIFEHIRETQPGAVGWPDDRHARAYARSISGEMHSGFLAVRDELPQNLRLTTELNPEALSEACRRQIQRVEALWVEARAAYGAGGPWLFGALSLADLMYVPVALRFATYGITLGEVADAYIRTVQALPEVQEWIAGARAEPEHIEFIDNREPARATELTLG